MTATLLVRADAGVTIGLGHAMRCLALGQALADERSGGRTVFLMSGAPEAFVARAAREGMPVQELRAPPGEIRCQEAIRSAGARSANSPSASALWIASGRSRIAPRSHRSRPESSQWQKPQSWS